LYWEKSTWVKEVKIHFVDKTILRKENEDQFLTCKSIWEVLEKLGQAKNVDFLESFYKHKCV
jgi:hypothetical protein